MPDVTLTEAYTCQGRILLPGTHTVTDEMLGHLRSVGAVPQAEDGETPSSPFGVRDLPPGAVLGAFYPLTTQGGAPVSLPGDPVRLSRGNVPTPSTSGVTPGDPVQRASATVGSTVASAVERQTSDPATGLPPPVVHTSDGEAVDPLDDGDDGLDNEDTGDGESDHDEDHPEDAEVETEAPAAPAEAPQTAAPSTASSTRPRAPRVTSRPSAPATE